MSEKDVLAFSMHEAIHAVDFQEDRILISADTEKAGIREGIIECVETIREKMRYCVSVMEQRGEIRFGRQNITLILNGEEIEG